MSNINDHSNNIQDTSSILTTPSKRGSTFPISLMSSTKKRRNLLLHNNKQQSIRLHENRIRINCLERQLEHLQASQARLSSSVLTTDKIWDNLIIGLSTILNRISNVSMENNRKYENLNNFHLFISLRKMIEMEESIDLNEFEKDLIKRRDFAEWVLNSVVKAIECLASSNIGIEKIQNTKLTETINELLLKQNKAKLELNSVQKENIQLSLKIKEIIVKNDILQKEIRTFCSEKISEKSDKSPKMEIINDKGEYNISENEINLIENLKSEIGLLKSENMKINERIRIESTDYDDLRSKVSTMEVEKLNLEVSIAECKGNCDVLENQNTLKTKQISDLTKKLQIQESKASKNLSDYNNKLTEERNSFFTKIQNIQNELCEAQQNSISLRKENESFQFMFEALKTAQNPSFLIEHTKVISIQRREIEKLKNELAIIKENFPVDLQNSILLKTKISEIFNHQKIKNELKNELKKKAEKEVKLRMMIKTLQTNEKEQRELTLVRFSEKMLIKENEKLVQELQNSKSNEETIQTLKEQLSSQKSITSNFVKELDEVAKQYSEAQEQCECLIDKLNEREIENSELIHDKVNRNIRKNNLKIENESLLTQINKSKTAISNQTNLIKSLETKIELIETEINEYQSNYKEMEKECLKWKNEAMENKEKLSDFELRFKDKNELLNKLLNESKSMKVELKRFRKFEHNPNNSNSNHSNTNGNSIITEEFNKRKIQDLKIECDHFRRKTICSVCSSREKDTILIKCFHMFCFDCIKQNVSSRIRKCPVCKQAFGLEGYKPIFLG